MAFRFPEALAQAIESRARATGRDKTTIVVQALTQAFGLPLSSPEPTTIEALYEQLSQVEAQIAVFSEQLVELRQTAHADEGILRLIAVLERTLSASTESDTPASGSKANSFVQMIALASQKLKGHTPESPSGTENRQLLHQPEHSLESILIATPSPVFTCDRVGRITYINPAGARVLGLERSQFFGKTCQELGLAPNLVAQHMQDCETVLMTGRHINGEVSIPTAYEGTRNYEYTLSPIQSSSGLVNAVLCTARDITERKHAEIALRESEANYRNLFEFANDSILIVDASTRRIMNANWKAAWRLGYTRSELLQLSETDIFVPLDSTRTEDISRELLATGSVIFECLQRCKNGTLIPVESSSRAIEYEGHLAIQSATRDVRRRQAELGL